MFINKGFVKIQLQNLKECLIRCISGEKMNDGTTHRHLNRSILQVIVKHRIKNYTEYYLYIILQTEIVTIHINHQSAIINNP